jgi:hypothetical protein
MARKAKPLSSAELNRRLDAVTKPFNKFYRDRTVRFAIRNGINLNFDALDNGRCSMNVRNIVRGMAKRGEAVLRPKPAGRV